MQICLRECESVNETRRVSDGDVTVGAPQGDDIPQGDYVTVPNARRIAPFLWAGVVIVPEPDTGRAATIGVRREGV